MAALSFADRKAIFAEFMRRASQRGEPTGVIDKTDLRAVFDAVDVWIDGQTANFNSALPLPGRAVLSAKHKAEIFVMILKRRWEVT